LYYPTIVQKKRHRNLQKIRGNLEKRTVQQEQLVLPFHRTQEMKLQRFKNKGGEKNKGEKEKRRGKLEKRTVQQE